MFGKRVVWLGEVDKFNGNLQPQKFYYTKRFCYSHVCYIISLSSSEVDPSSDGLSPNEIISKYIKKICWLQLLLNRSFLLFHRFWEI